MTPMRPGLVLPLVLLWLLPVPGAAAIRFALEVSVTRTMEGGQPVTERLTVHPTAIEEAPAANPIEFQPPHGFRHREPRPRIPD